MVYHDHIIKMPVQNLGDSTVYSLTQVLYFKQIYYFAHL